MGLEYGDIADDHKKEADAAKAPADAAASVVAVLNKGIPAYKDCDGELKRLVDQVIDLTEVDPDTIGSFGALVLEEQAKGSDSVHIQRIIGRITDVKKSYEENASEIQGFDPAIISQTVSQVLGEVKELGLLKRITGVFNGKSNPDDNAMTRQQRDRIEERLRNIVINQRATIRNLEMTRKRIPAVQHMIDDIRLGNARVRMGLALHVIAGQEMLVRVKKNWEKMADDDDQKDDIERFIINLDNRVNVLVTSYAMSAGVEANVSTSQRMLDNIKGTLDTLLDEELPEIAEEFSIASRSLDQMRDRDVQGRLQVTLARRQEGFKKSLEAAKKLTEDGDFDPQRVAQIQENLERMKDDIERRQTTVEKFADASDKAKEKLRKDFVDLHVSKARRIGGEGGAKPG